MLYISNYYSIPFQRRNSNVPKESDIQMAGQSNILGNSTIETLPNLSEKRSSNQSSDTIVTVIDDRIIKGSRNRIQPMGLKGNVDDNDFVLEGRKTYNIV